MSQRAEAGTSAPTQSEGDINSSPRPLLQDHDVPLLTLTPALVTRFAQMDQALDIIDACLAEESSGHAARVTA